MSDVPNISKFCGAVVDENGALALLPEISPDGPAEASDKDKLSFLAGEVRKALACFDRMPMQHYFDQCERGDGIALAVLGAFDHLSPALRMLDLDQASEAQAEAAKALALIESGLCCGFDDKMVPLTIDDDSDHSVGLDGTPYLSLPDGYDLVPSSFLRGIKRTMGEDLYEKSLDLWRQIHDPNYGAPQSAAPAAFAYEENECPGHVASEGDAKVCAHCGVHIDSLRPPEDNR